MLIGLFRSFLLCYIYPLYSNYLLLFSILIELIKYVNSIVSLPGAAAGLPNMRIIDSKDMSGIGLQFQNHFEILLRPFLFFSSQLLLKKSMLHIYPDKVVTSSQLRNVFFNH